MGMAGQAFKETHFWTAFVSGKKVRFLFFSFMPQITAGSFRSRPLSYKHYPLNLAWLELLTFSVFHLFVWPPGNQSVIRLPNTIQTLSAWTTIVFYSRMQPSKTFWWVLWITDIWRLGIWSRVHRVLKPHTCRSFLCINGWINLLMLAHWLSKKCLCI